MTRPSSRGRFCGGESCGVPRFSSNRLCGSLISRFSAGSDDERIRLQCRRPGFDPWVGKILWRRERLPNLLFWPGEFHGLYSPLGCKESDMTEQLALHFTLQMYEVDINVETG